VNFPLLSWGNLSDHACQPRHSLLLVTFLLMVQIAARVVTMVLFVGPSETPATQRLRPLRDSGPS
jgi:hypothetical protein